MTREEKFDEAMKKRKEEKVAEEEKRSGNWGGVGYEPIPYCALESNQVKIVRLLGLPNHVKETKFDAKIINLSMIAGDNDKPFRCIWPLKEERPDWILWRIFDRVMEYEWDGTGRVYKHKDTHPTIFQKVFKNNKPHIAFEKGWKPSVMALLNCFNRGNMEWHEENKKAKVLSKKVSEKVQNDGTSTFWYDAGIPKMLYDMILDDIVTHYGDWTNYDIAITKLSADPWYKVANIIKRQEEFDVELVKIAAIYARPLTDKEKLYQMNDLDQLYKVTSYQKLRNRLKVIIQLIDSAFNTNYFEELTDLAEKEKKEMGDKQVNKAAEYFEEEAEKETQVESAKEQEKVAEKELKAEETPVRQTRAKKEEPKEEKPKIGIELNKLGYGGIKKCTEEEIALIIEIKDDGTFVYAGNEQLFECPEPCGFEAPGNFHCCPKCGQDFE